jgi:hypothetical protein
VDRAALTALRRRRRRLSNASFFVAGIGFGTLLYLLRAHFQLLSEEGRWAGAAALLAVTIGAFYLGARADAEVRRLDQELMENGRDSK